MAGRIIDRAALSLLGTSAAYLLFLNAGLSIGASAVLAFACACLARAAIVMRPRRFAASASQAEAALAHILAQPDPAAKAALVDLARAAGAAESSRIVPLLLSSGDLLDVRDVWRLWRRCRGDARLTIAVPCPATREAAACAAGLRDPVVVLLDRERLMRAVRRTGRYVPAGAAGPPPLRRLRRAIGALADRRTGARAPLTGLALLGTYLATGRAVCLALSMLVLLYTGVTWIRAGTRT